MSVKLFDDLGNSYVCERAEWKKCKEHKHYRLTPPPRYNVNNINIDDDEPMFSMDGTLFTSEEFLQMKGQGSFSVPVRLSYDEVSECDSDTLQHTFAKMIAGEHYTRDDIVIYRYEKTVNNVVFFDVTYLPKL